MTDQEGNRERLARLKELALELISFNFPESVCVADKALKPSVETGVFHEGDPTHRTVYDIRWFLPTGNPMRLMDYYGLRFFENIPPNAEDKLRSALQQDIEFSLSWINETRDT